MFDTAIDDLEWKNPVYFGEKRKNQNGRQWPFCENMMKELVHCILIWNNEKCDQKWFSVIQNGCWRLFAEKNNKNKLLSEQGCPAPAIRGGACCCTWKQEFMEVKCMHDNFLKRHNFCWALHTKWCPSVRIDKLNTTSGGGYMEVKVTQNRRCISRSCWHCNVCMIICWKGIVFAVRCTQSGTSKTWRTYGRKDGNIMSRQSYRAGHKKVAYWSEMARNAIESDFSVISQVNRKWSAAAILWTKFKTRQLGRPRSPANRFRN